jgi:hypothetical protein
VNVSFLANGLELTKIYVDINMMNHKKCLLVCLCIGLTSGSPGIASATGQNYGTHEEAVQFLMDQLICPSGVAPNPTPLLQYLVRNGNINIRKRYQTDSTSCWPLDQPFVAHGLSISHVCAFDTSELVEAQHPDLYTREPGTAQDEVTIFTSEDEKFTLDWIRKHILVNETSQLHVSGPKDIARQAFPYKEGTMIDCER